MVAIELANGDIVTEGKGAINSFVNADECTEKLAGITDRLNLISPESIATIEKLKRRKSGVNSKQT